MDGTGEDATILKDDGVHVNWPIVNWKRKDPSKNGLTIKYKQELSELEAFFCLALNYTTKKNIDSTDIRLEAMKNALMEIGESIFMPTKFNKFWTSFLL